MPRIRETVSLLCRRRYKEGNYGIIADVGSDDEREDKE